MPAQARRRELLAVWLPALLAFAVPKAGAQDAPAPLPAQLYVLNISGPTLFASDQHVTDNGAALVSLPRMRYRRIEIAAGAHELRFRDFPGGKRVARLDAEPGQTYYLVVGYSPARSWAFPLMGDSMLIKLVDEAEAVPMMQEMTALP